MQVTVVEAGAGIRQYWKDLLRFRELIVILAWRDLSVRYKQTVLGVLWSAIRPIVTTLVFTILFGRLAQFPTQGVPYPIIVLSGLLLWQFFSQALESTSSSIIANANLVGKVYFPRLVIPLSSLAVSFIDLMINAILLMIVMIWYSYLPPLRVFYLPFILLLTMLFTLGLGLWLSALSARYRDFRIIVPFFIQTGFYLSPVGYSSSLIPEKWAFLYALNPLVGFIDGIRYCLLHTAHAPSLLSIVSSLTFTWILFISGILFFRAQEQRFADVI